MSVITSGLHNDDGMDRLDRIEMQVQQLEQAVQRTHVILHGDDQIGFSFGALSRLRVLESMQEKLSENIITLTQAIESVNEQRKQSQTVQMAIEAERLRWIKVAAAVLGLLGIGNIGTFIVNIMTALN